MGKKAAVPETIIIHPAESSPSATLTPPTPKPVAKLSALLYVKDKNVFMYSLGDKMEKQLTQDGTDLIVYSQPKWAGENLVSFVRCNNNSDPKVEYRCTLARQQINGGTPEELVSLTSKANANGFQVGGMILSYTWNSVKTTYAYIADIIDPSRPEPTEEKIRVMLVNLKGKSEVLLEELPPALGRGGTLDDSRALEFSLDGKKLLVNDTSVYPLISGAADKGTLQVFNLDDSKSIWEQVTSWTAFAHWLDDTTIIAKQTNFTGKSVSPLPWNLVKIHLLQKTEAVEVLAEIPTWHGLELLGGEKVVFWSPADNTGKGIQLEELNLTSKAKSSLKDNLLPLTTLDEENILVGTMKTCAPNCGMDVYNGVTQDGLGVYNINSGQLQTLAISGPNNLPYDFDSR